MPPADDRTSDDGMVDTVEAALPASHAPDELVLLPAPYAFRRELSRGGMGRVLIAWDARHGREVAVKLVRGASAGLAARFAREAQVTARLQHPAIVPVYDSGQLADGEPFYVMRLVSGRSLDRWVENRRLPARLALLPQLIAAADAVAYAHDRHVVHRDLKPQNILLGQFGETVVIDWGLAKDLVADVPSEPGPPSEPGASSSGLTISGQVLGTPAYMPPEQARGDEVDERADVYSIGAVLYTVLAGAPPYDAPSSAEVLTAVLAGPPPRLASKEPGVPADLEAIVHKAMARDPRDRYASAGELAEDLKRFQAGQRVGAHRYSMIDLVRRFTARQRAAVAVGLTLLTLLAAVTVVALVRITRERDRANARRVEAQDARAAAEGLVQYMMAELAGRLQRLGRLDLLKGVGEALVRYEERTAAGRAEEPSAGQARALELLAEAEGPRGDLATAERALKAALEIRRARARNAPGDPVRRRELLAAQRMLAQAQTRRGEIADALAFVAQQPALAAEAESSYDPLLLVEIGAAHRVMAGAQLLHKENSAAIASLTAAVRICERAITLAGPGPTEPRLEQALSLSELAEAQRREGDAPTAMATRRRVLGILESLSAEHPADAMIQSQRLSVLDQQALLLTSSGQYDEGAVLIRRELSLADALAARDEENAEWQSAQVLALDRLASLHFDRGEYPEARRYFEQSLEKSGPLLARGVEVAGLEYRAGHAHSCLGWIEVLTGHPEAGIAPLSKAVAVDERVIAHSPEDVMAVMDLIEDLSDLGYASTRAGRYPDAVKVLERAAGLIDPYLSRDPENYGWRVRSLMTYGWLGDALTQTGRRDEARAAFRHVINDAAPSLDDPRAADDNELVPAVAEATFHAVDSLGHDAPPEALPLLERALALLRPVAARGSLYASAASELPKWERTARQARTRAR